MLVGAGGFVGSALRFALGGMVQRALPGTGFPIGILAVNVLGCAVIGMLSGISEARGGLTSEIRLLVVVGLLGGFTTYSTFANDGVAMLRDREFGEALINVALHVLVGFSAVWFGHQLTSRL